MLNLVQAMMAAAKLRQGNTLFDGSVAGLRISAVDGTAFLDNLPAAALGYVNGRNWATITDSAGKKLEGVLKAKGTGETLGSELVPVLDFTSGWSAFAGGASIIDADSFETTIGTGGVLKGSVLVIGQLIKAAFTGTTTGSYCFISNTSANPNYAAINQAAEYKTAQNSTHIFIKHGGIGQTDITSITAKQVLTPSTSGAVIVDGELSTTENFASVEAGFAFNESSYSVTITREREV